MTPKGDLLLRVRAGSEQGQPALTGQRSQRLVVDSPIPWEPVTRASWNSFLLQALCFQDEGLVSLQVSGPRDQLSCVTAAAGLPLSSRRRTLGTLMKTLLQGGKVRGRRNQSRPADTDLFRSGCISGLNQGTGFVCPANKQNAKLCCTVRGYSCKLSSVQHNHMYL